MIARSDAGARRTSRGANQHDCGEKEEEYFFGHHLLPVSRGASILRGFVIACFFIASPTSTACGSSP
jgi:hypothetical protein